MNGISFERPFKFSYKNGDNVRTYKFIYDMRKEIYHEKIETLYFIDTHDIELESYHTTYFKDFRDIEMYRLYSLIKNGNTNIFIESIDKLLKTLNKPMSELNLNNMLQLITKTELLILQGLKNATAKKDLKIFIDNKTYVAQNNLKESLQHLYTFLKIYSNYKEVTISKIIQLANEKLICPISKIILYDLCELSKNKKVYNKNPINIMTRAINDVYIYDNILMELIKTVDIFISSITVSGNVNKLIEHTSSEIGVNIFKDLEMSIENQYLLSLIKCLIYKYEEDATVEKGSTVKESINVRNDKSFVINAKNISYTNKLMVFIKDFYDYINTLSENKADKVNIKDIFKDLKENLSDLEFKDIYTDDVDIATDKSFVRSILLESVIKIAIRYILKEFISEKEDKQFIKDILKNIFFDVNDKNTDKEFTNKVYREIRDKYLEKGSYNNKDEFQVLIEEVSSFSNNESKDIVYIIESLLVKHKDLLIFLINDWGLLKDELQTNIERYTLLNSNAKNISYLEDTLLFSEQKILNLEDERQLTLWKRFWFLCAGKEIDIKILPYYDFPYETDPIHFENIEDLYPENWNVTHPHEFWKKIDYHPVEHGTGEGLKEIKLAINIMIDVINILILMWAKHYSHFWGWTGTQAVLGLAENVYEWLRLETSLTIQEEKDVKPHYDRCFRWLRWEVEKVALMARNDMELRGNYWVGILIEDLINYMLDHHFEVMPLFEDVNKMDEWRRSFDRDLQKDIEYVIEKIKGIRHKLIEGKERKING